MLIGECQWLVPCSKAVIRDLCVTMLTRLDHAGFVTPIAMTARTRRIQVVHAHICEQDKSGRFECEPKYPTIVGPELLIHVCNTINWRNHVLHPESCKCYWHQLLKACIYRASWKSIDTIHPHVDATFATEALVPISPTVSSNNTSVSSRSYLLTWWPRQVWESPDSKNGSNVLPEELIRIVLSYLLCDHHSTSYVCPDCGTYHIRLVTSKQTSYPNDMIAENNYLHAPDPRFTRRIIFVPHH